MQDIPLNIAAFDDSLLEAREISDLAELGRNVPGLYVIDQGKRSANSIVVRGLNLNPFQSAEFLGNTGGETVATYVGEIPLYVDLTMTDVERVEVLLGPQGTLYGAGTLGGAIRYIPRKPEFDDTSVSVRGSTFAVSESDSMGCRGGATFNVPFGDNLAFRASIDQYDDPGFIDTPYLVRQAGVSDPEPNFANPTEVAANLYRDDDVDWEETTGARVALRWQPGDNVDATFTYHYQNMEVGGRTQNHVAAFGTGLYESATRFPEPNERRNELLSAEIVADLGFAELTSATGCSKYDERRSARSDRPADHARVQLRGVPDVLGVHARDERGRDLHAGDPTRLARATAGGTGSRACSTTTSSNPMASAASSRRVTTEYLGGSRPDNLEYISVLYEDLTEKALCTARSASTSRIAGRSLSARATTTTRSKRSSAQDLPLANTVFGGAPRTKSISISSDPAIQDESGSLFKFNTSYRFSDDVLGYFTISEGYRIGASNGIPLCDDRLPAQQNVCATPDEFQYLPDTTTNYEIGLRSQWLDRRLTLNGALYYIDWQDPQLTSATATGAQPITINGEGAETTRHRGGARRAGHGSLQPRLQLFAHRTPSSRKSRRR